MSDVVAGSKGECVIDWDFIQQIQQAPLKASKRTCTSEDGTREEFVFSSEDFENAVVMPSYRNIDQPQYFYVAEIRHDLNPQCSFPSPELYDTFEHYYKSKYGLKITNLNQPLLDVDHTSARLNLLTPRYMNQKGVALPTSSAETRKARRENLQQKQILIPELCDVHPFPASLWRKAVCLPAILYRVNYLLIAEELRLLIAREARIGIAELSPDFCFPELEFGFSTKPTAVSSADTSGSNTRKGSTESQEAGSALDSGTKAIGEDEGSSVATSAGCIDKEQGGGPLQNCTKQGGPCSGEATSQVCVNRHPASDIPESNVVNVASRADTDSTGCNLSEAMDPSRTADASSHTDTANPAKREHPRAMANGIIPSLAKPRDTYQNSTEEEKRTDKDDGVQGFSDCSLQEFTANASNCTEDSREGAGCASVVVGTSPVLCLPSEPAAETPAATAAGSASTDFSGTTPRLLLDAAGSDSTVVSTARVNKEEISCDSTHTTSTSCSSMSTATNMLPTSDVTVDAYQNPACDDTHAAAADAGPLHAAGSAAKERHDEEEEGKSEQSCAAPIQFDHEEDLSTFVGPSPCIILQTLTMSNANDFFNLERLETIGDSFLKFAITVYLYCTYPGIHEGKLSYLRSKQVSNYNLYKLGKRKHLPDCMIAAKFEPMENWLPPGYVVTAEGAFKGLNVYIASSRSRKKMQTMQETERKADDSADARQNGQGSELADKEVQQSAVDVSSVNDRAKTASTQQMSFNRELEECLKSEEDRADQVADAKCLIPYNLQTQHSLPDKSIADCVEALIGCYLVTCGQTAALQLMSWLGLKVLPEHHQKTQQRSPVEPLASAEPSAVLETQSDFRGTQPGFGLLHAPLSPLLTHIPAAAKICAFNLNGYQEFEKSIQYTFQDKSYLLQAFTHASYHYNTVTDCYQR